METVDCRLCGEKTDMLGTRLCDRCWEMDTRIRRWPDIARRILMMTREGDGMPCNPAPHGGPRGAA
jgi:hypothetical protein